MKGVLKSKILQLSAAVNITQYVIQIGAKWDCWPKYMTPVATRGSSRSTFQGSTWQMKHYFRSVLRKMFEWDVISDTRLMTLTFRAGDLYNSLLWKLSLLTSVQFHDYITHLWLMASAEHRSSAHRDCSAWPEQTNWFALTKSVGRLPKNLLMVIQLARFTCLFW